MYNRLQAIENHYEELGELSNDPEVISDTKRFMQPSRGETNIRETVEVYRCYEEVVQGVTDTEELLGEKLDNEVAELAKEELSELEKEKEVLEEKIRILLLPKDPNDDKNTIMEVHGAAGGDEAALFVGDLFNMYQKCAEAQSWETEVMEASVTGVGGYKEMIMMITGDSACSKLEHESGVRRVQRVLSTESQGRIHASTTAVVIMPEAEEIEVDIEDKDIRTDIYHASGAGGQHISKTASIVRLTHLLTRIVVAMQDERSQIKNHEKVMKILHARVYDKTQQGTQSEHDANQKSAVGIGDHSERIRTYNLPQNRATDRHIGLTIQKLDQILAGKLDEIIDALVMYNQTSKLEAMQSG